jgi:4-hydroxymandelate oxidase
LPDLAALEGHARERLDRGAYDYFAGGAEDELTLADNVLAWERLRLRPHVLRDVAAVSTATTVLGAPVPLPVLVGPIAYQRLAHPDGELATGAAAARAGTVMVLSTQATSSLEAVAEVAPEAPRWFQLYVYRDRRIALDLVRRAAGAGYRAVVLTVDVPVPGNRLREKRNRFRLPESMRLPNLTPYFGEASVPPEDPEAMGGDAAAGAEGGIDVVGIGRYFDPSLTLETIGWLRRASPLPVVVKGVLRGDDALACVRAGASAVVVSNHGGRQLDGAVATADALAEVVDAVAGGTEVYVDGGIRRGVDVVKALALGARAVLVARPIAWGLATAGAAGVTQVLGEFRDEVERTLALCGTPTLTDLTPDLLARPLPSARHN